MTLTQKNRPIAVYTDLGEDVLLLARFSGTEAVSEPFAFRLEMLSTNLAIDPGILIGTRAKVRIQSGKTLGADADGNRWFHGHIARFVCGGYVTAAGGTGAKLRRYTADLVPGLWFLKHSRGNGVFTGKSAIDIAKEITGKLPGLITLDTSRVNDPYATEATEQKSKNLELFHLQYNETDFDFLSRKLEDAGVCYFFKNDDKQQTMVLGEAITAFEHCLQEPPSAEGKPPPAPTMLSSADSKLGRLTEWEERVEFRAGVWNARDYSYTDAPNALKGSTLPHFVTSASTPVDKAKPKAKVTPQTSIHEWPGGYQTAKTKEMVARIRAQEIESTFERVLGASTCPALAAGTRFSRGEEGATAVACVLLSVTHDATCNAYLQAGGGDYSYSNTFEAMPLSDDSLVYRPARTTPVPRIHGMLTAKVTGTGEGVNCDEQGRVWIRFHFQEGTTPSCPVRVSHMWAGKNFGAVHLPHIGQEVLVSFIDGNPDRPIITGRVYNSDQGTPLGLPANKEKSVIRDHGGNWLLMDGTKDKEHIELYQASARNQILMDGTKDKPTILLCSPQKESVVLIGTVDYTPSPVERVLNKLSTSKGLDDIGKLTSKERYKKYSEHVNANPSQFPKKAPEASDGVVIDTTGNITMYADDIKQYTGNDKSEYVIGNWYALKKGDSYDTSIGRSISRSLSAKLEFALSTKMAFSGGASLSVDVSEAIKISLGLTQEISASAKVSLSASAAMDFSLSAKLSVNLGSAEKKVKGTETKGKHGEYAGLLNSVTGKKEELTAESKCKAANYELTALNADMKFMKMDLNGATMTQNLSTATTNALNWNLNAGVIKIG